MKTIYTNVENSKMGEPQKLILNLSQRLDLESSNKHVLLQKLSLYYTQKNIRLKIVAPTQNDEFELPGSFYSVSDMQDYIKCIIKNETLSTNPPIHIYINTINNRLVVKIKDGYKLNLQPPETIKSFGSTKKLINKTKN